MHEENLAIVNMNYRLVTVTEFKHPAQVNDIGLLTTFLSTKSAEYNISPNVLHWSVPAPVATYLYYMTILRFR